MSLQENRGIQVENFLEIGQIVNSYGLKGQMKIVPFTDNIPRYNELKTIYIEDNKQCFNKIGRYWWHKRYWTI